jgi:hypothetical protein
MSAGLSNLPRGKPGDPAPFKKSITVTLTVSISW